MTVIANATIEVLAAALNLVARQANTTDPPKAPDQGGLINPGHALNPAKFDAANPIRLLFIQIGIILTFTTLLAIPFRYIRQPKVIAEVLCGIILGPSVMGHVAGFTDHIFPQQSRSYLSLVANTGLVVYLFIVGLELDTYYLRKNIKLSAMIGAGGMALPFSVGIGFATVLFKEFVGTGERTHFIVFIGVCFSITAFPVLCRILTALNLLDTTVGISVLAAGVGNDIIAWVLLALAVALVNAVSGLTALYILIVTVAWAFVVMFPIRWVLRWLAYKTGSVENGPSQTYLTVVLLVQFASAFFTDIIGVHPIFGAFLVGIAVPRDGNLAIRITEKIEDFVMIIMLPLYFTLSGLNTNLSELNSGKDWGFIIAIATLDFSGKFISTSSMARLAGFKVREALAVGSLMSCKGLVELVVLNVGLSAHILPRRLFSMFVVEALVLTSMTSPLVMWIYPPRLQTKIHGATIGAPPPRDAEGSTDEKDGESTAGPALGYSDDDEATNKSRFLAVLDKAENLSAMLSLTQLFQPRSKPTPLESKRPEARRPAVDTLRLIELSDRTSAVMMGQNTEAMLHSDPLVSTYRTFTGLNDLAGSASLSVAEAEHFATSVDEHATARNAQLVLAAWVLPYVEAPGSPGAITTRGESVAQSNFLRNLFVSSSVDVVLSVDPSNPSAHAFGRAGKKHIFLPFFGGPDDRLALKLLVQIVSASPDILATVVRITKSDLHAVETAADSTADDFKPTITAGVPADTVYGNVTTQTRLQSETADNILLAKLQAASDTRTPAVTDGLKRITFSSETTPTPLARITELAHTKKTSVEGDARFVVFIGRSRRMATENHAPELAAILKERGAGAVGSDVRRTVGDVASALALSELGASLVIIQAVVSRD